MPSLPMSPVRRHAARVFSAAGLAVLLAANTGCAAPAAAPSPPPAPPTDAPAPPRAGPLGDAGPAVAMQAVVSRLVINPDGDIDGFLTKDGVLVHFPPHLGAQVGALLRPGAAVQLSGRRDAAGTFRAERIVDTQSGQQIVDQPPPPGARPTPRELRGAGLSPLSVQGRVTHVTTAPRGEPDGVILADGSVVKLTPPIAQQFPDLVRPGAEVSAQGYGTRNRYGTALQATAFGAPGSPTQLYGRTPPAP